MKEKILTVENREGQKFYFISPQKTETATLEENNVSESDVVPLTSGKKGNKKGKWEKVDTKLPIKATLQKNFLIKRDKSREEGT